MTTKTYKDLAAGTTLALTDLIPAGNPSTGLLKKLTVANLGLAGNVRHYGALGDGTTDDSTAIADCLAANGIAYFPPGNYRVPATIPLSAGQSLLGVGSKSRILCNLNSAAFTLAGDNLVDSLKFETTASGGTSTIFLSVNNTFRQQITNCFFKACQGSAVKWIGNNNVSREGGNVANCQFVGNLIGCESGVQGEYWTISGSQFTANTTGIKIAGGNNAIIGCDINANTTGINLVDGTNDSHAMAVGCKLNHNTSAIVANSATYGYRFIGCMIYYGAISLTNSCDRIQFESCDIAELTITGNTCTNTTITGGGAVSNVVFALTDCPILGYEIGSSGLQIRDFGATTVTLIKPVLAEHADNAAAVTASLAVGTFYRTGDAVKVVHA